MSHFPETFAEHFLHPFSNLANAEIRHQLCIVVIIDENVMSVHYDGYVSSFR